MVFSEEDKVLIKVLREE